MTMPAISLVIPNLNGRHHFEALFASLATLNYPSGSIQTIVVDNASADGSVGWLARHAPGVRVVPSQTNLGFAAGVNAGVDAATGDVLVFLNNDMRVEADWLRHLVEPIAAGEADCTTGLILSWDGRRVNFGGSAMNFHGIGWQVGTGDPAVDRYLEPCDTLFPCGGSMAVRRDVYDAVGRLDDDFFAYYEDVDLGFRLWVLGYRVRYTPGAVVYHHHQATSRRIDIQKVRLLQMRNPLWLIYKNYEDATLARALPAALLVHQRRTGSVVGLDDAGYRIAREDGRGRGALHELSLKFRAGRRSLSISPLVKSDFLALDDFSTHIEIMREKRRLIQCHRRRPDTEILRLFRIPLWSVQSDPKFVRTFTAVVNAFGLPEVFGTREIVVDPQVAIDRSVS